MLLAMGVLLGSGALVKSAGAEQKVSGHQGATAPDFELTDFAGHKQTLSQYRGKPVVLNFWASWCGPCREELPELARAEKQMVQDVQFLGVNLSQRDSTSVADSMLFKYHVMYPNLKDDKGKVADLYDVFVIPTTVIIDKDGKVAHRIQGPVNAAQLEQLLQKLR